ncbi:MAG: uracil phosphoribosyltransferase [Clostridia bacterium]|nr:uracil phosphoribosyltransferase [Clostridia bacterium]
MKNIIEITHPLVQHKITMLRDSQTSIKEFRELVKEISTLMWYEVTRDLPLKEITVETPIATAQSKVMSGIKLALVPILRSGLAMAEGIESIMPSIKIGHIGLYREAETLMPKDYYCKLPTDIETSEAIILEPMLATGGSACAAIELLIKRNVKDIKIMSLIAAPEGVKLIEEKYPDVKIYVCSVDKGLNEDGFIVPGFGDAGDRMFGTK